MNDLISRQAAIDAITAIDDGFNCDIYTNEVREILSELPSVQPFEDIHREKEQAYYCGYEDGAKAARSALRRKDERSGR